MKKSSSTPIFGHIKKGNTDYVRKNINKYNTADKDPCSFSCLLGNAIYHNQPEIVNVILDENIQYRTDQLICHNTNIIQQAVHFLNDLDTIERVILRYQYQFDINAATIPKEPWHLKYKDNHYKSFPPLFNAVDSYSPEKVSLLLKLGADPMKEYMGKTALEFAKSDELQKELDIYKEDGVFKSLYGAQLSNTIDHIIELLIEAELNLWTQIAKETYCDETSSDDEFESNKRQRV